MLIQLRAACLRLLLFGFLCLPVSATVNVRSYGAHGDGIASDTAQLNKAFSAACGASEDIYIPAGTYLVNSLEPLKGCGILVYGDGVSATILKLISAPRPSLWSFEGRPERTLALVIRDLALDGGHFGAAGISVEQYQSVTIERVIIHDFGTPGYRAGHKRDLDGLYVRNVENVRVTDSQFTGNERYGIELQAVHSSTVRHSVLNSNGAMGGVSEQNFEGPLDGPRIAEWLDNTLEGNGGGGIDVETDPKLPPAQGILRGNRVIDCGNDKWDAGWGLVIGLHAFGIIEANWVEHFAANGAAGNYTNAIVYGESAGPITISNNTVIGTRARAIAGLNGAFPVTITGNTLADNGAGIFIYNSPRVQITNNVVKNSLGSGIDISRSYGHRISGNQLAGNLYDLRINGRRAIQR